MFPTFFLNSLGKQFQELSFIPSASVLPNALGSEFTERLTQNTMSSTTEEQMPQPKTVSDFVREIGKITASKGFHDLDRTPGDLVMLIVCELAEALEEIRDGHDVTEIYYNDSKPTKPEGFPVEIADSVIRLFDLCYIYGIPLEGIMRQKMAYNETRIPLHGKTL
jgi:NTP pyrophosphatase (non-canonical NTP hydrolase)